MNRSPYNSTSNRSPSNSLPLRKAIIGFLNFKTAAGLSQRSVDSYQRTWNSGLIMRGIRRLANSPITR